MEFNSWSPGWRGCDQEWPEWFCPCTASDAGLSPPAPSKHQPAESERVREREKKRKRREREQERERKSEVHQMNGHFKTSAVHQSTSNRLTSSLDALSISAARHWALVWQENRFLASYKLRLRIWALRSSFWSRSLWFSWGKNKTIVRGESGWNCTVGSGTNTLWLYNNLSANIHLLDFYQPIHLHP